MPLEVWNPKPIKHNVQLHFANQFHKNYTAYINTPLQNSRYQTSQPQKTKNLEIKVKKPGDLGKNLKSS